MSNSCIVLTNTLKETFENIIVTGKPLYELVGGDKVLQSILGTYMDKRGKSLNKQVTDIKVEDIQNFLRESSNKELFSEINTIVEASKNSDINIYFGNNENPTLSNMGNRPFSYSIDNSQPLSFTCVEQAFQYYKYYFAAAYSKDKAKKEAYFTQALKILNTPYNNYPAKYRSLGRGVTIGDDVKACLKEGEPMYSFLEIWNGKSSTGQSIGKESWGGKSLSEIVMKNLILASFNDERNKQALQQLLNTNTATLTHIGSNGKDPWRYRFPDILTEVRKELTEKNPFGLVPDVNVNPIENQEEDIAYGIKFTHSESPEYPIRTKENATNSDITLAFAIDYDTRGEKLTKESAKEKHLKCPLPKIKTTKEGKKVIDDSDLSNIIDSIIKDSKQFNNLPNRGIVINIAGNQISTFSDKGYTQDMIDDYIYKYIKTLQDKGIKIAKIISGGQSGSDEAGAKAGAKLGIPTEVHTTLGWVYNTKDGETYHTENGFKSRFRDKSLSNGNVRTRLKYSTTEMTEESVKKDSRNLYVTIDNTDINGSNVLHIHTTRTQDSSKTNEENRWNDSDESFNIFKVIIDDDIKNIIDAINTGNYGNVYLPKEGLFNSSVSGITKDSRIGKYLTSKLAELEKSINSSTATKDGTKDTPFMDKGESLIVGNPDRFAKLSTVFSPSVLTDRHRGIATKFSNVLTIRRAKLLKQINKALSEETDKKVIEELTEKKRNLEGNNSRLYALQLITPEVIFKKIKDDYIDYVNDYDDNLDENDPKNHRPVEAKKIIDNFDTLVELACADIENKENIRLTPYEHVVYNGENPEKVLGASVGNSSSTEEAKEEDFRDDPEGNRATGNDGWSFKIREVNPYATLTTGVKRVLADIVRRNKDGDLDTDDMGNMKYLDPKYAHAVLLNELSYMTSPEEFNVKDEDGDIYFPALEKMKSKYPWVIDVIMALQDDEDLMGNFYADLRKDFISYSIQHEKSGDPSVQVTQFVNLNTAEESLRDRVKSNISQGIAMDTKLSIYDTSGELYKDKENLKKVSGLVTLASRGLKEYNSNIGDIVNNLTTALHAVGFDTKSETIRQMMETKEDKKTLMEVCTSLSMLLDKLYDSKEGANIYDVGGYYYKFIASKIARVTEIDNVGSFKLGSKSRYSYSAPNYIDTMLKKLKGKDYKEYVEEEFGQYSWFKKDDKWRNGWLEMMMDPDEESDSRLLRESLASTELLSVDKVEYSDWTESTIKKSFINQYFSCGRNESTTQFAWYNMPIFSDAQAVKFVKFKRFINGSLSVKEQMLPYYRRIVLQELDRIRLVNERKAKGVATIQNFDKNGSKFCFFPELNDIVLDDNGRKISFLDKCKEIDSSENLTRAKKDEQLAELIDSNMLKVLDNLFDKFYSSINDKDKQSLIQNLDSNSQNVLGWYYSGGKTASSKEKEAGLRKALEEYYWNQTYASSQMIELTTTDLAFYNGSTDFQKRFKEVYASGIKLNTGTKLGKKTRRAVYLADQTVTSTGFNSISKALDYAIEKGRIQDFDKDNIMYKFKDIDATDGQAYTSPKSMRSILDMIGAWTPEMEASYERFEKGEWDMSDFNTIWQTIKPFVYTQIPKDDGFGHKIKVPHQNKNSEYMLLAAYDMIANSLGGSPKLRAIQNFMDKEGNDIDVVEFQSAVKVGGECPIDISYSPSKMKATMKKNLSIERVAREVLGKDYDKYSLTDQFKTGMDALLERGEIDQEEYNKRFSEVEPTYEEVMEMLESNAFPTDDQGNRTMDNNVVHEIPYDDYVIQQPTPEHLFDATAVYGSQLRNLIIADLSDDFEATIGGKKYNKKQLIDLYNQLTVENLLEDFKSVKEKFQNIETLQKYLISQVKGSINFSRDMLSALQLVDVKNPDTGEVTKQFNIPLNNPGTTIKLQELITSAFRKGITEQTISGGAAILASDFGFTDKLKIAYKDDGSIEHIECYLPAYSKKFFEPLMVTKTDKNGNTYQELDVNALPDDLKKIVGYRIPTEDKYSIAPLYIKGFLPQQNGSTIMLPAEVTKMSGSDFDVDKMFLMIPQFIVSRYDKRRAFEYYYYNEAETNLPKDDERVKEAFEKWFTDNKERFKREKPKISKINYNNKKEPKDNSRAQRDNMLIDLIYSVLTNVDTSYKVHTPGSFDKIKIQARINDIINDKEMFNFFKNKFNLSDDNDVIDKLLSYSLKDNLDSLNSLLKEYSNTHNTERNSLTIDTFCFFHKQNMTGKKLVGIYANNTTMQAKYQHTNIALADNYSFNFNGRKVQSLHEAYVTKKDSNGKEYQERISGNCSQFSAASVDNTKDPVLANLLQNSNTANITCFMLRAGMNVEEISLMFMQPLVQKCINETGSLRDFNSMLDDYESNLGGYGISIEKSGLLNENFTSKDLMMNVINYKQNGLIKFDKDFSYTSQSIDAVKQSMKAAYLFQHIMSLAEILGDSTQTSRADSPNAAMGSNIAAAQVQLERIKRLLRKSEQDGFPISGLKEALNLDVINMDMTEDELRESLYNSELPMLQAFTSLGIDFGIQTVGKVFNITSDYNNKLLQTVFDCMPDSVLRSKEASQKIIQLFYRGLTTFALSDTEIFGDDANHTFREKREYYLKEFPKRYLQFVNSYSDVKNMGIFQRMKVNERKEIVLNDSGQLDQNTRDQYGRDLENLLHMNVGKEEYNTAQFAFDLFMYSYYKDGFWFGPTSFGNYFNSNFLSSFHEVIETLRFMNEKMVDGSKFDNFLPQFFANNAKFTKATPFIKPGSMSDIEDGYFQVKANAVAKSDNTGFFPYIKIKKGTGGFRLATYSKVEGNEVTYHVLDVPDIMYYNANTTVEEMYNEQVKRANESKEKSQEPPDDFFNDREERNDDDVPIVPSTSQLVSNKVYTANEVKEMFGVNLEDEIGDSMTAFREFKNKVADGTIQKESNKKENLC